jgi:hypothetical protein
MPRNSSRTSSIIGATNRRSLEGDASKLEILRAGGQVLDLNEFVAAMPFKTV